MSIVWENDESVSHVFLTCKTSKNVWSLIFGWLKVMGVRHNNILHHMVQFRSLFKQKGSRLLLSNIWTTTIWSIWSGRNELVFNGKEFNIDRCFKEIKSKVWSWMVVKEKLKNNISFSEWNCKP